MIFPYIGATLLIWIQSIVFKNLNLKKIISILIAGIFILASIFIELSPILSSLPGGVNILSALLVMYLVKSEDKFDFPLFVLLATTIIEIEMFWCLSALLAHFCYRENKNNFQMFMFLMLFLGELIISAAGMETKFLLVFLALAMLVRNIRILKTKNWNDPSNFVMSSIYAILLFKYIQTWDLSLTSLFSIFFIFYILSTSLIYKEFNTNSVLIFVVIQYLNSQSIVLLLLIPLVIFLQKSEPKYRFMRLDKFIDEINVLITTLLFFTTIQALSYFKLNVLEGIFLIPLLGLALNSYLCNRNNYNTVSLDKLVAGTTLAITLGILYI